MPCRILNSPDGASYEFRLRKEGMQVDFALWLDWLGRFALQVKGGSHRLDSDGQWYLNTPDGGRTSVESPLQEAANASIELCNAIEEEAGYRNYVAGLLFFSDMERDEFMERVGPGPPLRPHHLGTGHPARGPGVHCTVGQVRPATQVLPSGKRVAEGLQVVVRRSGKPVRRRSADPGLP